MRFLLIFSSLLLTIILFSCDFKTPNKQLKTGIWRGEITTQSNEIPFLFEIIEADKSIRINLLNGNEKLSMDNIIKKGDSLIFNVHIFDVTIKARVKNNTMEGTYSKNYAEDYVLPFKAVHGEKELFKNIKSDSNFDGKWQTSFYSTEGKETPAIGTFKTVDNVLTGTFLTRTGDYRYLQGYALNDTMKLFTFDGNHLYKFSGVIKNDSMVSGQFWSGKTGYKTFLAKKNDTIELDSNEVTFLKKEYDKISFSFPGLDEKMITLEDEKYKNKVVVLQIFGTWCPNCMDETKFLSEWYAENKNKEVEIIGLAYENKRKGKTDFDYAKSRVQNMKKKYNVGYDFLIAGTSSTKSVSNSLPMLSNVISFPTTIFIDKRGNIRKIHSGFSGPATGIYYDKFVQEFNSLMNELLMRE